MELNESILQHISSKPEFARATEAEKETLVANVNTYINLLTEYQKPGVKQINFNPTDGIIRFVGKSGRVYKFDQFLAAGRYPKLLVYEVNIRYSRTIEQMGTDLQSIRDNWGKDPVGAGVTLNNLQNAIANIGQERSFVYLVCALCCNEQNEDVSTVNLDKMDEKIADWVEYDYSNFFTLVGFIFPSFFKVYEQLTQTIMETPVMHDLA